MKEALRTDPFDRGSLTDRNMSLLDPFGFFGPLDDGGFGSLFEDRSPIDHFNPSSPAICFHTKGLFGPFKKWMGICDEMDLTIGPAAAETFRSDMLRDIHLRTAKGTAFLGQRVLFGNIL